jgi:hypothetical protein
MKLIQIFQVTVIVHTIDIALACRCSSPSEPARDCDIDNGLLLSCMDTRIHNRTAGLMLDMDMLVPWF